MSPWTLVLRGLVHHRRLHAGVALGTALAAAVLVGALVVGDSVRASLRRQVELRLGRIEGAVVAQDRFFVDDLAERTGGAAVLQLAGVVSARGGEARAGGVQVLGIGEDFARFAPGPKRTFVLGAPGPGEALVSKALARRLGLNEGDSILVRLERPSALPRDVTLATSDDASLGLRVRVRGVLSDDLLGGFDLSGGHGPALNVFLSRSELQAELELGPRANLLLAEDVGDARGRLDDAWTLADVQLTTRSLEGDAGVELLSDRVFLDGPVVDALAAGAPPALGLLTYFVNGLEHGDRITPYSMVSGVGTPGGGPPPAGTPWAEVLGSDAPADALVVNRWLADDLDLEPGDAVTLRYFVVDEAVTGTLVEEERELTVHAVVPLEGAFADPSLMPAFPGLADAEHCRDWEPGVMVDLDRIRDQDEAYWEQHRGTPKAFVTLATAQEMWGSRFGRLTAARVAADRGEALTQHLRDTLDPASQGLFFHAFGDAARAAGNPAVDFGGLFLGLSCFLIAAAVLLTALLFAFGVEQRSPELGALLAMGFTPAGVRRLFLGEALGVAILGGLVGAFGGTFYARAVLEGLGGDWRGAVASAEILYDARPLSLVLGAALAVAAAVGAIFLALRRTLARSVPELFALVGGLRLRPLGAGRRRVLAGISCLALVAGGALFAVTDADGGPAAAGAFFGSGALLLVAALGGARLTLARLDRPSLAGSATVGGLGARNGVRRPARSLATVALLAAGVFLVVAVQANRLGPVSDPGARDAGTGGFQLIGRSSLPVLEDLNRPEGREAYALEDQDLEGVGVVGLRVRDGDDASCLNLGTPTAPRLVGTPVDALAERGAFRFARTDREPEAGLSPWTLLRADLGPRVVPAVGDQASVQWTLKLGLGEGLEYLDERGEPFEVRLVATLADSVLQGDLLIDERHFTALFPSESGRRMFLVDAPAERVDAVSAALTRGLSDQGLELERSADRLEAFHAVQNTYLAIFQALGGLGLLLGTAGLALVVLRNTLERRAELAALSALGFPARSVRWLILSEHGLLLAMGLAAGAAPALVAVLPAVRASGGALDPGPMVVLVGAVGLSGLFWAALAARLAVRGSLVQALRND